MKILDTLLPKKTVLISTISKNEKRKIKDIAHQNTPNKAKRGVDMTDSQKEIAERIKEDIKNLYKEGYSIRMITNHYNDLYPIRNIKGEIVKEAISRETVRKILNNKEVSLKSIIGNPNLQF